MDIFILIPDIFPEYAAGFPFAGNISQNAGKIKFGCSGNFRYEIINKLTIKKLS
jgi:hypothetical protein